jgi:hypothetical protein
LRQGSEDVQDGRIDVCAQFWDDERHPVCHQSGNKMHVARQAIELANDQLSVKPSRQLDRGGELGAALECVRCRAVSAAILRPEFREVLTRC